MKARQVMVFLCLTALGAAAAPPDFREVYGLVRSNLAGVNQEQLDQAAVEGLMKEFPGRVSLVEERADTDAAEGKALRKFAVYDEMFAYFQIARVTPELPGQLREAWKTLSETNKVRVRGIVLDLRFAAGDDYKAAGLTADCFLPVGETLLEWPGATVSSVKKDDAITAPVAILVNAKTAGAAEALAAMLRVADRALTVGGKTAGEAAVYKEFPLSNGEKLRIATADVKLAGGPSLAHGLEPDIPVKTSLENDKGYMADPFHDLGSGAAPDNAETNQPMRRFNEAELVREHREGLEPGEDFESAAIVPPGPPMVADPSLARALDLLKGLAVINKTRPG